MRRVRFRSKSEITSHLSEQKQSGLQIAEYCNQHGIPVSTFFSWQKRSNGGRKEVVKPSFAHVTVSGATSLQYEIARHDITVRVPVGVEPAILRSIVTVLHELS
jgi:hypothetical protein